MIHDKFKERYSIFEGVMRTSREPHYLEDYNSLPSTFNWLARNYENLIYVNLSNNEITKLPKEFGSLPFLRQLVLSRNYLGAFGQCKWLWIEQPAIRKNLLYLDISYNLVRELPVNINKLRALRELKISHNELLHLPQYIEELTNLQILDVSHNKLSYLPVNIDRLSVYLDISMNPFKFNDLYYFNHGFEVPTIVEFSANVLLKQRVVYDASILPIELILKLDKAENCFTCGRICVGRWCITAYYIYDYLFRSKIICKLKAEHSIVKLEICYCVFCCSKFHAWFHRKSEKF